MKKLISLLFCCLLYTATINAQVVWDLSDGVLTFSGTGAMPDYYSGDAPWYNSRSSITTVIIKEGVISIGDAAFYDCTALTSVTIPNSVSSIGYGVFYHCIALKTIDVSADNNYYCSIDGVLFNKSKTILIEYPGGKQGDYTIPNSVTDIGYAFSYCIALTSVTIPNSVTTIGNSAFNNCSSLTSVTIPNSITSIDRKSVV